MKSTMTFNKSGQELIQQDTYPLGQPRTGERNTANVVLWLIAIAVLLFIVIGSWRSILTPSSLRRETVRQPIAAARAEVQISTAIGLLDVSMNRAGQLFDASFELDKNDRLEKEFALRNGTQFIRLEGKSIRPQLTITPSYALWFVRLAPNIPLKLSVKTGVGASRLDLSDLSISNLDVKSGVGRLTVVLPNSGLVMARIQGGVGEINVLIPSSMKAKIHVKSGLGGARVVGQFIKDNNVYTTEGFTQSSNRTELEIQGGVGGIRIEEAGW